MLKLYNSYSNSLEEVLLSKDKVKVYLCGPTVQSSPHIGHGRSAVVFDFFIRYLKYLDFNISFVRNITDIEDKIILKSAEQNIDFKELAENVTKEFKDAYSNLNCIPPDVEPKATEYISKMIEMITSLIEKEYAYVSANHVLFESKKFDKYGALSKLSLKDIISGARVEVAEYKKNPEDFVLWKPSKENEPYWESPWGKGRPGWHIECSAMIAELLGPTIDIHAGGLDLIFPHHENEIAQSCCYHDRNMANYWLHNGFINFDGEKMSKSLGNITIMNELLDHHDPVSIKYAILTTHYRQPIDFSNDLLKYSSNIVSKWRDFVKKSSNNHLDQDFLKALEDDLNTPQALMRLQQIFNDLKKTPKDEELSNCFNNGLSILGLVPHFQEIELKLDNDDIENMIARRADAKSNKNFELADQIREELLDNGIILEDTKSGTKWKKA